MNKDNMAVWHHQGHEAKEIFRYTGCGLEDVYLASGYDIEETPYGQGVAIRNLESLHVQIGIYLAKNRKTLNGKEIRFLRHQMDLTQSELARLLGCNAQQVARYEKNKSRLIGPADRVIRVLFEEHVAEVGSIRDMLDALDRMDDTGDDRLVFEDVGGQWRHAA